MTERGTRTEDLNAIHPAPPGTRPADQHLRRWGRRNYTAGITLAAANIITAFLTSMLAENQAFTDPDGVLIATLTHIAIMILAGALVIVGALQTITAHTRADIAAVRDDIERNRKRLDQHGGHLHDQDLLIRSHIAAAITVFRAVEALPERLDKIEGGIAAAAEHLPDALNLANWRGYAAAERVHEKQRTGTDGEPRPRPPYINLVNPESTGRDDR